MFQQHLKTPSLAEPPTVPNKKKQQEKNKQWKQTSTFNQGEGF